MLKIVSWLNHQNWAKRFFLNDLVQRIIAADEGGRIIGTRIGQCRVVLVYAVSARDNRNLERGQPGRRPDRV